MVEFLNSIIPDITFTAVIVLIWLWFTCGPLCENRKPFWETLENQIVFVSLIIGGCSIFLMNIGIEGTAVERFIKNEIIGFQWSWMAVVNLVIAMIGVTAITLTQSSDPKVSRYACIFGLIGQPAWYALAIMADSYGLLAVSVMYTQAWWKGFDRLWIQPWQRKRESDKLNALFQPRNFNPQDLNLYHGYNPPESPCVNSVWSNISNSKYPIGLNLYVPGEGWIGVKIT